MRDIKVSRDEYPEVARHLREEGYRRLLTVSAVDWIEEGCYEVYFLAHHLEDRAYVKVTTEIPRDSPTVPSLSAIWPNAAMHEREMWELFGINPEGNPMLEPLFLEDWIGPPPFRRDFNWREYVGRAFGLSEDEEGK